MALYLFLQDRQLDKVSQRYTAFCDRYNGEAPHNALHRFLLSIFERSEINLSRLLASFNGDKSYRGKVHSIHRQHFLNLSELKQ